MKLWYWYTSVPYGQMLFPLKLAKSPHISHLNRLFWDSIMTIACYRKKKFLNYIEYVAIVCDCLLIFFIKTLKIQCTHVIKSLLKDIHHNQLTYPNMPYFSQCYMTENWMVTSCLYNNLSLVYVKTFIKLRSKCENHQCLQRQAEFIALQDCALRVRNVTQERSSQGLTKLKVRLNIAQKEKDFPKLGFWRSWFE